MFLPTYLTSFSLGGRGETLNILFFDPAAQMMRKLRMIMILYKNDDFTKNI